MSVYRASLAWALAETAEDFLKGRYARGHELRFEDGPSVRGTASAHVVGARFAEAGAVDPEQLLIASLSSCHMLTFVHVAREAGFVVAAYDDDAQGVLEKDAAGKYAVTRVTLKPKITWQGAPPDAATLAHLHHEAHEGCFIASSVKTEVVVTSPT